MARSRAKSEFLRRESGLWDQLHWQKELVDHANGLLAEKSAEAEDLRLRCANLSAEAASTREQVTPLEERAQKLEEDLARMATVRDTFRAASEQEAATAKSHGEELDTLQTAYQQQGPPWPRLLRWPRCPRRRPCSGRRRPRVIFACVYFFA